MGTASLNSPDTLIPPRQRYDEYISRQVGPNTSEFDVFNYALKNKMNILIDGPTGNGKTSAALAFAALHAMPFYAVQGNGGAEPSQVIGKMIQGADGVWHWQDGGLTALFRLSQSRPCLLLLNEINLFPPRIVPMIFSATDKRRSITVMDNEGEVIEAGDLLIIADENDGAGYVGTRSLSHALRNRFHIKLRLGYDDDVESQLLKSTSLRSMARRLRDRANAGDHNTPVSTNSLIEFEQLANGISLDFACENFMNLFPADYREAVSKIVELEKPNIYLDYNTKPQDKTPVEQVAPKHLLFTPPVDGIYLLDNRQDTTLGDYIKLSKRGR